MKNIDVLAQVYRDAIRQVAEGKGAERHGKESNDFLTQPWRWITDGYGSGFLLGQVAKKMHEAAIAEDWTDEQWEREMLGAIAYLGFAVVHRRIEKGSE